MPQRMPQGTAPRPPHQPPHQALHKALHKALHPALQRAMRRATWAALLSGLLLVQCGRREAGAGAVPLNAISHWIWPRSAFRARGLSARHTATGALIHYGASCFWSALFEARHLLRPAPPPEGRALRTVQDALVLSALAAWVDLVLVPPALSPGFERRLSGPSLCLVYLGFAAGLVLGEPGRRPLRAAADARPDPREFPRKSPRKPSRESS